MRLKSVLGEHRSSTGGCRLQAMPEAPHAMNADNIVRAALAMNKHSLGSVRFHMRGLDGYTGSSRRAGSGSCNDENLKLRMSQFLTGKSALAAPALISSAMMSCRRLISCSMSSAYDRRADSQKLTYLLETDRAGGNSRFSRWSEHLSRLRIPPSPIRSEFRVLCARRPHVRRISTRPTSKGMQPCKLT
jgi:hypothetical protein